MKKKLTLLLALLCASMMSFAVQYCNTTITATDGATTAKLTCTNPLENTYVISIHSDAANFSGIIGDNFFCKINGSPDPNCHMVPSTGDCAGEWNSTTNTYTFTIISTTAPIMTTPLYLNFSGQKIFETIQNQTFDWPTECIDKTDPELSVNSSLETLDVGGTFQIIATKAEGAGNITYESANPSIATVSNTGLVEAVGSGLTTITVSVEENASFAADSKPLTIQVNMPKKVSAMGYGSLRIKDADLYNLAAGDFAGLDACGKIDLFVITYGNKLIYRTVVKESGRFENCTNYFCQLRTHKPDMTSRLEHWALTCSNDMTYRTLPADQTANSGSLSGYGDDMMLSSYMVLYGCGARTIQTVAYKRNYINNYDVSDITAPILGSATVTPGAENMTISFDAVTSEDVFYMIKDEEHGKLYYSFDPSFVLPNDGSGITYNYSCYAIDYSGNVSAAQLAEVTMPFSAVTNLALDRPCYANSFESANHAVYKANDGTTANDSRWSSGGVASPELAWWAVDLGTIYNLASIEMSWEGAYSDNFIIYGADNKPSAWDAVAEYETNLVTNTVQPTIGANNNNIYPVSGHARYLLFVPSHLANNGWGASFYEFRVFGSSVYDPSAGEDTEDPVISGATLASKTHNSAVVTLTASDDMGVVKVKVTDATNSYDRDFEPEGSILNITGLNELTTYNFTLVVYDAVNKSSEPFVMDAFETLIDPNIPQTAAPVPPVRDAENVLAIYSDSYSYILKHDFSLQAWGSANGARKVRAGNNYLLYDMSAHNWIALGVDNGGTDAIVAEDGYHGPTTTGLDASTMERLHVDLWSNSELSHINVFLENTKIATLQHDGSGWNQYDIEINIPADAANVRFMKFDGINDAGRAMFAIDNIYFWKNPSNIKSVSATSNNATMGSATVKVGEEDVTSVAEGTEVRFIATANPGYVFVNWTKGGVEVSTSATYVATITETTNLVANFDYIRNAYCHTEILTNNNKKLYLSISKVADNTYRIRIDGSAEVRINGRNNFNFTINHTNDYSNEPYADGHGWQISNEGYGYIENTFTANDYKALTFGSHYFAIGAQGGGEFILDNNFPAATSIDWNATCSDTEEPVIVKAEAEVLNESSVRLKIQATDNWEGSLTYTITRAGADDIILNGASGEELTQEVTGLTAGTEYTFTVTVSDGVNNANQNIVVTPVGDETKPVMGEASLDSKTWNSAIINVAATDNKGVTAYYIVELAAEYVAAEGKITVTGLTAATAYTFTIKAKDAAGNISDNQAEVSFTTDAHLLAPATAAPVPTWPANQVKSIYSDSYSLAPSAIPNYNDCWWDCPNANEGDVEGNNYMLYNLYRNGMIGVSFADISVATMEKIHIDIWASATGSLTFRPITTGGPNNPKTLNLLGQQWNSFDIEMSEFDGHNWADLYQYTFENYQAGGLVGEYIAVDNVYFYRETALTDDEVPTNAAANLTETGFYSVKITASAEDNSGAVNFSVMNGAIEVATGSAATATATTITVNGLTPGTAYSLNVIAKDDAGNEAAPVAVAANTLAAPTAAPVPTVPATAVKSLYSNAYTTAVLVAINYREWWWESPNVQGKTLGAGDDVLFYDNNHQAGGSFGWAWSGENKVDFSGFQKLHLHIYPAKSGTIEIYPVIAPEGEFHKVSQTLTAGQWNEIILDYTDKTFAPLNQVGFVNFYALGEFFVDNVYFFKEPSYTRPVSNNIGTLCVNHNVPAGGIQGATFYQIVGKDANGKLVFDEVTNGLVAGEPYIFESTTGSIALYYDEASVTEPVEVQGMKGSLANDEVTLPITEDNKKSIMYISNNKLYDCSDLVGTGLKVLPNRCYIDYSKVNELDPSSNPAPGRRRITLGKDGQNATTDVDLLNAAEAPVKMIIDGKMYILRGEKMYNANGQLVK